MTAWESPITSSRCGTWETERVTHTAEEFPVDLGRKVASPVWMDINQSDTCST